MGDSEPMLLAQDIMRVWHVSRETVVKYKRAGLLKPVPKPAYVKRDRFRWSNVEDVLGEPR